jgi:hypothetical protein
MHIFSRADVTPRHFDSLYPGCCYCYDYPDGPTKPFSFHTLPVPTQPWTNIRVAPSKPSPHGIETWPLLHIISGFRNYEILQVLQVTNNPTFFRAPIRSATSHSTITSTSTTTREEEKLHAKYKCTMYHVPCTMYHVPITTVGPNNKSTQIDHMNMDPPSTLACHQPNLELMIQCELVLPVSWSYQQEIHHVVNHLQQAMAKIQCLWSALHAS